MRLTPISSLHPSPPLKLCLPNGSETRPRVPSIAAWPGSPVTPVLRQTPRAPLRQLNPCWGSLGMAMASQPGPPAPSSSSLGFCCPAQGARERSSAAPAVPQGAERSRWRRADGKGSDGIGHRGLAQQDTGDGGSWPLAALCMAREAVAPWAAVPGGCCDGEQQSQLIPHPRAGSWAAPSTWEETTFPSRRAEGCATHAEMSRSG